MLGRRPRKSPQQRGQGAAAAKQLGLFLEFSPEGMMQEMKDDCDDGDLEAELAAITGENVSTGKVKAKGKTPLPMDHIEKMAADCMKDLNDDDNDDDDLEEDDDLLAELQEVLGDGRGGSSDHETETIDTSPVATDQCTDLHTQMPSASSELQQTIEERITKYKEAIINAKKAGESTKVRRYERGLKTLETMLTAVKKGKKVNEEEMPPPVASGKSSAAMPPAMPDLSKSSVDQDKVEDPEDEEKEEISAADHELKNSSVTEFSVSETTHQGQDKSGSPAEIGTALENNSSNLGMRALLVTREKEYKLAALKAKQEGDLEKAKEYMRTGKKFSMVLEALDSGQPIDLKDMPLAPHDLENPEQICIPSKLTPSVPVDTSQALTTQELQSKEASSSVQQPKTVLEALEQRLEKYKAAAVQAKASGADRKSRMHERIAKQYQDAIRAHKAGRKVNFSELPVPPGFPPIPGVTPEDDSAVSTVLENASRLVKMEEEEEDRDDDEGELSTQAPAAKKPTQLPKKPMLIVQPLMVPSAVSQEETSPEKDVSQPVPITVPEKSASIEHLSAAAREHIEFLESRKKQYLKAAIQAKKKNNLEQAKMYLRTAKSFDSKIELAKTGKLVDISKLPSPPTDDEGDFIFIHHEDVRLSQKAEEVYVQLIKLLREQHEKCLQYSKQFMHLGNVTETSRFEKLAQNCKKDLEILQLAQAQGLDPPSHHFEERTFKIVRIFSELSSTEMHLIIVRGINLPAPPGVAPNDLDAFVKFEFHYPNSEQAQKSKTSVIKNSNCPEYDQLFKLNINRNHRGFRRAIQAKGIKFEILHKGSFFRSDKQVGVAHLKLDKLESECEIREIIEVLDGRKSTGGKLEVKVRLREPLSGQDLQTITENWLVLDH